MGDGTDRYTISSFSGFEQGLQRAEEGNRHLRKPALKTTLQGIFRNARMQMDDILQAGVCGGDTHRDDVDMLAYTHSVDCCCDLVSLKIVSRGRLSAGVLRGSCSPTASSNKCRPKTLNSKPCITTSLRWRMLLVASATCEFK